MAPQQKTANLSWKDKIHPEEYQILRNTFDLFDEDNSGTIDPDEVNKIMDQLGEGRRGSMYYEMIASLKGLGGKVTFDQFVENMCVRVGDVKTKDGLRRIFSHADKNGDEVLDFEEVKKLCKMSGDNLNDDDIMEMLHTIHVNHHNSADINEGITFEDFYNIVTRFYKK